jgi:hypothetical protein
VVGTSVIPYPARVVGLLVMPLHATADAVVALVAVAAFPEMEIPQVPDAPVPVTVGTSVIPYPALVVGVLVILAHAGVTVVFPAAVRRP